ncbi:MAG: DUF1456 family protein [Bacteroidales bacterium]|nr:DUF1456 family protein [Bacteroidales bacterium]
MTNNDILRRIRFIFDFSDSKMIGIFGMGGETVTRTEVSDWLKKDDDPAWKQIYDKQLAGFLNGLIIDQRGKKEGPQPVAEKRLNNNIILRKLKIAFSLRDDDMIEIIGLGGKEISKHELSAFFRNPTQSQYRPCKDQILRCFLQGWAKKNDPVSE